MGAQVAGQTVEVQLACHLETDDARNPIEVLTSLDLHSVSAGDADVQVLSDAAEPPPDPAGVAQDLTQSDGRLLGVRGRGDLRFGGDLDERDAQPVEVVDHLLSMASGVHIQFARRVLLQAQK